MSPKKTNNHRTKKIQITSIEGIKGYQPVKDGYQPSERRGFQPKQISVSISPPKGGTGESRPRKTESSKKEDHT